MQGKQLVEICVPNKSLLASTRACVSLPRSKGTTVLRTLTDGRMGTLPSGSPPQRRDAAVTEGLRDDTS